MRHDECIGHAFRVVTIARPASHGSNASTRSCQNPDECRPPAFSNRHPAHTFHYDLTGSSTWNLFNWGRFPDEHANRSFDRQAWIVIPRPRMAYILSTEIPAILCVAIDGDL